MANVIFSFQTNDELTESEMSKIKLMLDETLREYRERSYRYGNENSRRLTYKLTGNAEGGVISDIRYSE